MNEQCPCGIHPSQCEYHRPEEEAPKEEPVKIAYPVPDLSWWERFHGGYIGVEDD